MPELAAYVENEARLQSCAAHTFGRMPNRPARELLGTYLVCTQCGGQMRLQDIHRYCQGFEAAGGDPEGVLQGYTWATRR